MPACRFKIDFDESPRLVANDPGVQYFIADTRRSSLAIVSVIWNYVVDNADKLASYGTFLSALTALVVAFIAVIQLRINRQQLRATQEYVDSTHEQVAAAEAQQVTARESLTEARAALKVAAYSLLDRQGPLVSVLYTGSPRTAVLPEVSEVDGESAFGPGNDVALPKIFRFATLPSMRSGTWYSAANCRSRIMVRPQRCSGSPKSTDGTQMPYGGTGLGDTSSRLGPSTY